MDCRSKYDSLIDVLIEGRLAIAYPGSAPISHRLQEDVDVRHSDITNYQIKRAQDAGAIDDAEAKSIKDLFHSCIEELSKNKMTKTEAFLKFKEPIQKIIQERIVECECRR